MKEFLIGGTKLGKIFRICIALTIILVLVGVGIGAVRVYQVKQERKEINSINQILQLQGLNDQVKSQISLFMQKYPNTKNVVITDKDDNILYSANSGGIEGKTKFTLQKDAEQSGVYDLKDGRDRYRHLSQTGNDLAAGFGKMMKDNNRTGVGQKEIDGQKPPMSRFRGDMPFLNSFKINDNLNIYYISNAFRENSLMGIAVITRMLLKLLGLAFWILIAIWIYNDSKEKGLNQIFWGIVGILTGILGLIIYLIYAHRLEYCRECKKRIDKNANYCAVCGSASAKKCSSCGQLNKVTMNYCPNCGAKQE